MTAVQANLCDMINSMIWTYYPWGWSISSLTPTNLNQQTQGAGSPPTGGTNFTGNQQDYYITGAWFSFPINLQFGGVSNANFGGGWPIALAPNGLSESDSTITVTLGYPHNLPVGSSLNGLTGTITGATVAGYNATLTITNIPSITQIVGTISNSGLANSGGSGAPNILRPVKMRIGRLDTDPPEWRELALLGNLSPELTIQSGIESMQSMGWFASANFFRMAKTPQVGQGQIIQIAGEYQMLPTKITDNNLATPFLFPDTYFNIFVEGLKWKIYQLSDDQRAGGIGIAKNGTLMKNYTGQYGIFIEQLMSMARTEDLNSGDEFQYPEDSLGSTSQGYGYGIYGL